jgi:hypothetical protein
VPDNGKLGYSEKLDSTGMHAKRLLRDMTGDGIIDQVIWEGGGVLKIAAGKANAATGVTLDQDIRTYTLSGLPVLSLDRFYPAPKGSYYDDCKNSSLPCTFPALNTEEGSYEIVDWNGDGRPDIVAVDEVNLDNWVVWLNTPGVGNEILWKRQSLYIGHIKSALGQSPTGMIPLTRSYSWKPVKRKDCWVHSTSYDPTGNPTYHHARCTQDENGYPATYPQTFVDENGSRIDQWKLLDVNGDGRPDLVFTAQRPTYDASFNHNRPNSCRVLSCESSSYTDTTCRCEDDEYMAGPRSPVMVFYNTTRGAPEFAQYAVPVLSGATVVESWGSNGSSKVMGAGFVDVNGDGVLDYVSSQQVTLRSAGSTAPAAKMWLPVVAPHVLPLFGPFNPQVLRPSGAA